MKKTLFAAIALLATACSPVVGAGSSTGLAAGLFRFDACEEFLSHVKAQALEIVTEYGLGYGYGYGGVPVLEGDVLFANDAAGPVPPASEGTFRVQGVDYSGTNLQEAGVDEPDIVKTDGERIYAVAQGKLFVLEIVDGAPVIADSLVLPTGWGELLLAGDRLLVLSNQYGGYLPGGGIRASEADYYYGGSPVSVLTEIDVSDASAIEVLRTLYLDGAYLSARMTGDVARVVVRSRPTGFVWEYPEGGGLRSIIKAREANREIIRNSTIENWMPYYILEHADGSTEDGLLIDCSDAYRPEEFSGLDMLTVVTVDLSEGLVPGGIGILAEGDTVYASIDSLYVASQKWIDWETDAPDSTAGIVTALHKFDISDADQTRYLASGEVGGFLLNQFSLSEHEGYLRVATTSQPSWWGSADSESFVSILAENDGVLEGVGSVGGLGKGERIFSVRFIGEVGYVVTFRQTDPLYTLNLTDPTNPIVEGELKIFGYSAYLHPLGDGLILGVGQDATEEGRTLGAQLSVFDVTDPGNPRRVHQYTMPGASSNVEFDHRAFLYWSPTATAVLPIQRWGWDEQAGKDDSFTGAIGLEIDRDRGIQELGTISHGTDWYGHIQRTLVVDGVVFSVSEMGVGANDLATFDQLSFVSF